MALSERGERRPQRPSNKAGVHDHEVAAHRVYATTSCADRLDRAARPSPPRRGGKAIVSGEMLPKSIRSADMTQPNGLRSCAS